MTYRLPDGSIYEVTVGTEGVDDPLKVPANLHGVDIDTLSGRELDAAVAVYAFGFEVEWRTNNRTHAREPLHKLANDAWVVVPYFSEQMGASVTLALRLQDLGWKQTSAPRDPNVTLQHADGRTVSASGGSESEPLARAAIRASGPNA